MLCERLRDLRLSRLKTQQEVADVLNLSRSAYALYESGRRELNYGSLTALADFYGVSLDYLFCRTGDPTPLGALSQEERELLERFRLLDQRGRRIVLALAGLESDVEKNGI